jgi:excisionase family DNA binding protein
VENTSDRAIDRAISISEAAQFLGVSRSFVYRLMHEDKAFPKAARIGARRRFLQSDLQRYLENKTRRGAK